MPNDINIPVHPDNTIRPPHPPVLVRQNAHIAVQNNRFDRPISPTSSEFILQLIPSLFAIYDTIVDVSADEREVAALMARVQRLLEAENEVLQRGEGLHYNYA
jgi:hypothetical protein